MFFGGFGATITEADSVVTASLHGDLDLESAGHAVAVLSGILETHPTLLCVDMSALSFIDVVGINALLTVRQRAEARGITYWCRNPSPTARRLFEMFGLSSALNVH
jgi:anti-anti-sigma factor